jgi:hypothetical protein
MPCPPADQPAPPPGGRFAWRASLEGYEIIAITSIQADGDNVAVSIDAYQDDGSVQAYNLQYQVVDGVIVSGSGTKA